MSYYLQNKTSLNYRHGVDEALFVLSGKGRAKINDTTYALKKYDFICISKETDHKVITEGIDLKILFVFGGDIAITH